MTLSEQAHERLADVVALQPTKNGELEERWGLDSGKAVHQYLEAELKDYYYRDENSLIRATPDAASLVGAPTGENGETVFQLPALQRRAFSVLPEPGENTASVVSVLHAIEAANADTDSDSENSIDADAVRSALRSLERKGIVETVRRTVPTFRLAVERDSITVEALD